MDLLDAARRKIEAQLQGSDWSLLKSNPSPDAVRCSMYSIGVARGPRLGGQMNSGLYRDLLACTGIFKKIADTGHTGAELLGPVLNAYDQAQTASQQTELIEPFMLALATYARSTKTWESLPPLSDVDGIHFVAVDWKTASGKHIIRPVVLLGSGIPPTDELLAGTMAQLEMHLSRFPTELPIGFEE